jgi:hypothetical protein
MAQFTQLGHALYFSGKMNSGAGVVLIMLLFLFEARAPRDNLGGLIIGMA